MGEAKQPLDSIHGLSIIFDCGVECTLSDGTILVADIYRPNQEGTYPVLLMRQPYGRDIASTVVYAQPSWFARQGFVVIIQDVRGRGDSEGKFYPFINEGKDGAECIEWIHTLPYTNENIFMYGFSYQGSTQLYAAIEKPRGLKGLAPHMTAFDLYSGWFYRDRVLQLGSTLGWGNQMLREDAKRSGDLQIYHELEESYKSLGALTKQFPINQVRPLTDPRAESYVSDWLRHAEYNSYWKELNCFESSQTLAEYPMFHISGWYDFYARGSLEGYKRMAAIAPEKHKLVVGPWSHIPWGDKLMGNNFGSQARIDTDGMMVKWFQDIASDRPLDFGVDYFVLGSNEWKHSATWPPEGYKTKIYFLNSNGNANSRFGDGSLNAESSSSNSDFDQYNYDPEVPVLGPGCDYSGGVQWGPSDLSATQQGNNLLCYDAEPEALTLVGQAKVTLFVKSTAPETLFVGKLSKVDPSGKAMFLTLGARRLSDGKIHPDGMVELEITFDDIAVAFNKNERIRLDVSSSAFPLLIRFPNTEHSPESLLSPSEFKRAIQFVFHSEKYPSSLHLPVID